MKNSKKESLTDDLFKDFIQDEIQNLAKCVGGERETTFSGGAPADTLEKGTQFQSDIEMGYPYTGGTFPG